MSIFRKLLLSFLTVALLIWAVAFSSFFIIRKTLIHSAEQESLFAAHLLMRGVDKDIRDEFSQLKIRMQDPGLLELLKASNESFAKIPDVRATIDRIDQAWIATPKGSFLPLMKEIWGQPFSEELRQKSRASEEQCGYPVFSEIFVTNRYGVNVAMTGRTTDYRQDDEAWWKEAWEKGKIVEDVKFDESSQTYALTLAVRIDDRQGVPLGVAKGVLNIRQILDFLEENRERQHLKNARIFLLDSHRRIIYPTEQFGKEAPESWREFSTENPLKPHECVRLMKGAVGGGKIAARIVSQGYMDYPGLGWSVVLENDVGEVLASLKTIEVFSLSVSALATFLALILGVFFSQRFSVSLKKLIAVAERCGKGDFEVKVGIVSQDEFGTLARGFEAMAGNLKNKTTSIENLDREIEERKLLEKISLENALFLQKLMNSIPSPVFYKDISGVYIGCNRAFEAFFGISQKELIGKKDEELFPPELAKMYQKKDAELFVLPGIQVYEASVGNATGKPRSIVFYKATFTGPSGEVQGIIGVIMDATIRRRAEEMLQESEERHRTLFESASDAIMILEPPFWKFATGNPAAIKMFKAKNREEFTSLGLWDLSPERQSDGCASAEMAKEMIETAMREGSCFFEWTHRRMSGENFPATVRRIIRSSLRG